MAYQKKYYYQFVPAGKTEIHIVELWQNTETVLTSEEITGGVPPFVIEMPELNHKFQVVRGTGATINILSATDMKFFSGLQHTDPTEFKVLYYIDSVLNWSGYLNSEMQSEPYDIDFNYIVTTTANDGFSLMDRFRFIQSDGTNYIGLKSIWELLQICLNKIALPYVDIRVKLATTFAAFSAAANSTILHELYVDCANFYDEDNLAMTLREVIDSILAPYGAFICQSGGSIYITDIHTLAGAGTITYKKYNASTYAYISDVAVVTGKTIASVGYIGTGQSIERSGGTNRQVVVYSPYPTKDIIEETIINTNEFTTIPETFSDKDGYKYRTLEGHAIWQNYAVATFEESYAGLASSEHFVYYRQSMIINDIVQLELIKDIHLNITGAKLGETLSYSGRRGRRFLDGVAFLITGDILTKTIANPYGSPTSGEIAAGKTNIASVGLNFELAIGSMYYNQSTGSFESSFNSDSWIFTSKNSEAIENKWVSMGIDGKGLLIKVGNADEEINLNGLLDFKIWSDTKIRRIGEELLTNDSILEEVWIRNLQLRLVNFDGSEISDTDIEYIGLLNPNLAQSGEPITLTTGTQQHYSDKGKILYNDGANYSDLLEATRDAQTFCIEKLLLNSLCSNYQANFVTLHAMRLKNSFGLINVLQETNVPELSGKNLMVKSAVINPADNQIDCDLVEIAEDSLTIEENINVFYGD